MTPLVTYTLITLVFTGVGLAYIWGRRHGARKWQRRVRNITRVTFK